MQCIPGFTIGESEEEEASQSEEEEEEASEYDEDEDEDDEEEEEEESEGGGDVFRDTTFVISGNFSKSQKEMNKLIQNNGGEGKSSTTKATDFVLVQSSSSELHSGKCEKARKFRIPIVTEVCFARNR